MPSDALDAVTLRRISALLLSSGLAEGWRVPSERELAARLGASRVTVRRALAALERAGLVAARRGSGVVLRHRRDWTPAALPALLRAGPAPAALLEPLAVDALAHRRALARRLPGELAGRLERGSLDEARARARRAWEARDEPARFVALDAGVLRAACEAAGAWSAAWLWNELGGVAEALAERLRGSAPVADDYAARSDALAAALECSDARSAERLLGAHLSRLDRGLLGAFAGAPGAAALARGAHES
jgi:GntR family transcriptional repressor for pyruvate dehydrogenase complex